MTLMNTFVKFDSKYNKTTIFIQENALENIFGKKATIVLMRLSVNGQSDSTTSAINV